MPKKYMPSKKLNTNGSSCASHANFRFKKDFTEKHPVPKAMVQGYEIPPDLDEDYEDYEDKPEV